MNTKVYYFYVYLDLRKPGNFIYSVNGIIFSFSHEPFYVGKGYKNRAIKHIRKSQRKKGTAFYNKLNSILSQHPDLEENPRDMIFIGWTFTDEVKAYDFETELITAIGSDYIDEIKNGPLTNMKLRQNDFNPREKDKQKGESSKMSKLTEIDVVNILKRLAKKETVTEIAKSFQSISNNPQNLIKDIKNGNTWKSISDKFFIENPGISFCFNRSSFTLAEQILIIRDLALGMTVSSVAVKWETYYGKISKVSKRKLFKQAWAEHDKQ